MYLTRQIIYARICDLFQLSHFQRLEHISYIYIYIGSIISIKIPLYLEFFCAILCVKTPKENIYKFAPFDTLVRIFYPGNRQHLKFLFGGTTSLSLWQHLIKREKFLLTNVYFTCMT